MTQEITKEEILELFDSLVSDSNAYHHVTVDNSYSTSPSFYERAEVVHREHMARCEKIRTVLDQALPMMIVTVKEEA